MKSDVTTPKVEGWWIDRHPLGGYAIYADLVLNHPLLHSRSDIRTSQIVSIDFANSIARTLNTTYLLGSPKGDPHL